MNATFTLLMLIGVALCSSVPKASSRRLSRKCVWRGRGKKVVVDLGSVRPYGGWVRAKRDGLVGIEFKTSPVNGISPPGVYGRYCFKLQAPVAGKYYLTAISYAPHKSEHNDAWLWSSKAFELWKRGDKWRNGVAPGTWLKAFQSDFKRGMSDNWRTIDFEGYRFLIPNVRKGEIFQLCIAGRSKKYEMYRIIAVKCEGDGCKGYRVLNLKYSKPSKCV